MRKSFILLLAFFLCVTGYAQKLTISGVVIDKDLNEPLTGVNVLVKGTTTGTITDFDGKYTLEADANSILVFSYLSMKTIEEPVNGRTKIDVTRALVCRLPRTLRVRVVLPRSCSVVINLLVVIISR